MRSSFLTLFVTNKMPPGRDGNKPSCMGGRTEPSDKVYKPVSPPREEKDKEKLVRVCSRLYSKDMSTTRRLNFGFEIGKSPSGIRAKSLNEIVSEKDRTYKPVNRKLPTCPGEAVRPPTSIPEE